jgi:DNA-binding transcriptional LysR family regulator
MGKEVIQTDKNAMALYVKVVENGSFSKAAVREGVPVSTVSRKIADLEKALGVRLLERSTRQLRMTEIGQDYFELCRRGLTEFEAADALVTDRQAEISGRLRISVPPSMSDLVVLPLVDAFQALYPKVVVHCLVTERYIDHIADGIDLSLRVGHPSDSSLVASTVTIHRPRLVASPGYLAGIDRLAHPQAVLPHVKVAFSRWERPVQWTLSSGDDTVQLNPQPRLVLNDYAGVYQGVIDGVGISEMPSFICETGLRDGRLVEVLPEWRFAVINVTAIYPSNRHLSPLVRAFKDFCVNYFERKPLA